MTPMNERPAQIVGIERGTAVLGGIIALALGCGVAVITGSLSAALGSFAAVCIGMIVLVPAIGRPPRRPANSIRVS
ncbi:hypothetical protein ABZV58_25210 [Nocardia sp. NPDC004654]|uniref:hypothetical protein n=1 Tax=Nocardia sp. NPDC004654 TaxID=3154776 RepID=UPI0033BC1EA5